MTDCLEDIAEFSKNKNPNVKLETIRFLVRCLRETKEFPSKPEQKQIAETSGKLLTESSQPIRDTAAEAMGTLMKIIGERQMAPYLEGLDEIRKTKIKEYCEGTTVKAKEKPKPPPPPPAAPKVAAARPGKPRTALKPPGVKKPVVAAPPSQYAQQPRAEKAPGVPRGGLRLTAKKPLAPGGGNASPRKPSPKAPSPVEDEPAPAPAAPRAGVARGLANRSLAKDVPPPAAPPVPHVDPAISAAEKAELEALRAERERWEKQQSEFKVEKTRLLQDINDLQLHNAQIIEEHTRDNLAIRAKEAQLVRARADAEFAQEETSKLKREVERLKRELQRSVRSTSPAPTDISDHLMNGYNDRPLQSQSRSGHRLSYASTSISEDRDNHNDHSHSRERRHVERDSAMSPSLRGQESGRQSSASAGGDSIESWKRAAEVTSQLKMRIEVLSPPPPPLPIPFRH